MKKLIFAHDGPLLKFNYTYYVGHLGTNVFERYKYFTSNINVLMRAKNIGENEIDKYLSLKNDLKVIEVPNFKSIKTYHQKKKAREIIHKELKDTDLVIARLPSAIGTFAYNYCKKNNIPVLVEFVACVYDALWNYDWRGKLLAHYKLRQYQKIIKKASHVIYVTNEFLQNRYPTEGKSVNISNVVLHNFDINDLNQRLEMIRKRDVKQALRLTTIAGVDVPYKGQDDVIMAIGILKEKGIKVKYNVVGMGSANRLKTIAKSAGVESQIEFHGALQHDKIFEFLEEQTDVYIQPSKQEGLPRALIEAMSKACPSLGARTAGIPELLSKKDIFEPGDVNAIVEKINNIHSEWMLEQARRNINIAKDYTIDILNERRKLFYDEFKTYCGIDEQKSVRNTT
jgi:glycosyltransferase involved in cell wall biosynthesis